MMTAAYLQPWLDQNGQALEMSAQAYFSEYSGYMTSHKLMTFEKSPALYFQHVTQPEPRSESAAFAFGSACHMRTLEGRAVFENEYVVADGPINARTGKPYGSDSKVFADWYAEMTSSGHQVISTADAQVIEQIALNVHQHEVAKGLLAQGKPELTVRAEMQKVDCQSRLDWYDQAAAVLVDLKTCDDLAWFEHSFKKYRYGLQLAFYQLMLQSLEGKLPAVFIIAVEKKKPHRVGVWQISDATLAIERAKVRDLLSEFGKCVQHSTWPTRYEMLREL